MDPTVAWLRRVLWTVVALVMAFGLACLVDAQGPDPPDALFGAGFHRNLVLAAAIAVGFFAGLPALALLLALRVRRAWVSILALGFCGLVFVGLAGVTVVDGWEESYGRLAGMAVFGAVLGSCAFRAVREWMRLAVPRPDGD
jgi:hypothetical protein